MNYNNIQQIYIIKLQPIEEFRGTVKFNRQDYSTQIVRNDGNILPKKDLSDGGKELYAIL